MLLHHALRLALNPATPDVVALVGGGGKSSTAFRLAAEVAATGKRAVIAPSTRIAAFQTAWAPAFIEAATHTLPWDGLAQQLDRHGYCLLGGPIAGDRRLGLPPAQIDELASRAADLGIAAITVEADGSKMRPIKAPAAHEPVLPAATTHLAPVVGLDAVGAALDARLVHRPEQVRQVLDLASEATPLLTPAMVARLLRHPAGGAKGAHPSMHFAPILNKGETPLRLAYGRLIAALLAQEAITTLITRVGAEHAPVLERWGQVAVVVLAAGGSQRLGRPKQLECVAGEPLVARAVRVALRSHLGPVLLVTGAHGDAVRSAVHTRLGAQSAPMLSVQNTHWEAGQASSVITAIQSLPATTQAAIFLPVDQPFLDPLLLRRLFAAWRAGADLAAPQVDEHLRGAPALFDRRHWPELLTLRGDEGGRRVLSAHRTQVAATPAAAAWLQDIDTEADLLAAQCAASVGDS